MNLDYSIYQKILSNTQWISNTENIPQSHFPWLMCQTSLTKELQKICHKFDVELLRQGWDKQKNDHSEVWLREVLLQGDHTPWIFAQTILPKSTIENVAQELLTLGEKPLGLWLFPQNPKRINLEWYQDIETGLFARRSILTLNQHPIEIKELFLNKFPFEKAN